MGKEFNNSSYDYTQFKKVMFKLFKLKQKLLIK